MAKIRVILETPDPEFYRTGELLEAELGSWNGTPVWFSPSATKHNKVFFADEVVEVSE